MDVRQKLDEIMLSFGANTDEELAKILDTKKANVDSWVKRKKIPEKWLLKIGQMYQQSINTTNEEYTTIKLYPNIKASCANGSVCVVEDYDIQEMKFPTSYLLNHLGVKCTKDVHAIVADGNSMEPLIKDGDILFVTPFDIIRDGNVYIVNVNGEIYCKKVFKNPITKGITLRGENESAPKYEIPESDLETVKFMGEVFVVMGVNVLRRLR